MRRSKLNSVEFPESAAKNETKAHNPVAVEDNRRRRYPEAHEEVDPKRAFDSAVGEFEREIGRAMYRAMLDPNETAEYASKVVPVVDPTLWRRLVLLGADVNETVRETFLSRETFLERTKRSKITGEKLPQFRDYVVQGLSERVSRAMENGDYAGAPAGDVKDECYRCGCQFRYSPVDADRPLFCRSCGTLQGVCCPVCGELMGKLPPRMLSCGKCGYRLQFKSDLRKEIASVGEYLDELAAGRIPPEEYRMLEVQRKLPDGWFEHTSVTVRPGNVPGSLVQKFHPSYISDNDVSDHLKLWVLFSSRRE